MCGIAGLFEPGNGDSAHLTEAVSGMTGRLVHRGPDDHGVWADSAAGVALGHRRLSIVELGGEGHQPMRSRSGRYVIVFNGEIYNFLELRSRLAGRDPGLAFRGGSDTEVMLAAFETWGLDESLRSFNGMFAFALWDRHERELILARDRLGEKPLYFGWEAGRFLFASELKAIRDGLSREPELDRDAVARFMRFSCVPAPWSIYRGIFKLPPGTFLRVSPERARSQGSFRPFPDERIISGGWQPTPYWSAAEAAAAGLEAPLEGGEAGIVDRVDALLRDSVRLRMQADVPFGAFLSGGLDSTTVVAMLQAQSSRAIKTFTIGFREGAYDEAADAKRVAAHLGTDHTEHILSPTEALAVIPRLPEIYDEPFADCSQIPTFLVSQLARRQVTVALTGDGGDEVFSGYTRYVWAEDILGKVDRIPRALRPALSRLLRQLSPSQWDRFSRVLGPALLRYGRQGTFGDKLHKVAEVLEMPDLEALYLRLMSAWPKPQQIVLGVDEDAAARWTRQGASDLMRSFERMMLLDQTGYLPDDILVKLDRASMAVSLEGRMPFLDHRIVELGWRVPSALRVRGGKGKIVLRKVLDRYVPAALIERPKMGFGVPIDDWLRGPLRDWAESLLEESRLRRDGYLEAGAIRARWLDHLSGKRNWGQSLWCALTFQAWLESKKAVNIA